MAAYTSPWETEELILLRDTAKEFFTREGMPQLEAWERQQHVDRDFWLQAGELGLLCPMVPEEYGGPRRQLPAPSRDHRGPGLDDRQGLGQLRPQRDRRRLHPRLRVRGAEADLAAEDGHR